MRELLATAGPMLPPMAEKNDRAPVPVGPQTNRRRMIMHAALAAVSPTAGVIVVTRGARAEPQPDKKLLQLGRALDAATAREEELWQLCRRTGSDEFDEPMEAAYRASSDVVDRIEAAPPARTVEGLQARARAVLWCGDGDVMADKGDDVTAVRLARMIVRDLLAMGRPELAS